MSGLFEIFNPQDSLNLSLNWIMVVTPILLIQSKFWIVKNEVGSKKTIFIFKLSEELEFALGSGWKFPGASLMMINFFLLVSLINFLGLFPYIFTPSSHLSFTLALALPLFLGFMLKILFSKFFLVVLSHLVPKGTPGMLMMFMVLIELISLLIRPLTLSVRLAANMIAGHMLLSLISMKFPFLLLNMIIPVSVALIMMTVLEIAVAFIQAYVFSLLMTLYIADFVKVLYP